ncbi:hypothetical protein [Spirulina subsalsa]|uniref:hypothetical protein n=1 Tax=Spirulina subsalsa TaxID=54311 RepID=UPI0003078D35|nr:hypothetical protein [Spirulina subsalsa]
MLNQLQLIPGALADIMASVADTQTLTIGDRYGLMAALLDDSLQEDERRAIDRILHAVRRGNVRLHR